MTPIQIQELLELMLQQDRVTPQVNELFNHARDLQMFLIELTDWLASEPGPMKTATYYQIQARAQMLRNLIEPPKPTRVSFVMH